MNCAAAMMAIDDTIQSRSRSGWRIHFFPPVDDIAIHRCGIPILDSRRLHEGTAACFTLTNVNYLSRLYGVQVGCLVRIVLPYITSVYRVLPCTPYYSMTSALLYSNHSNHTCIAYRMSRDDLGPRNGTWTPMNVLGPDDREH